MQPQEIIRKLFAKNTPAPVTEPEAEKPAEAAKPPSKGEVGFDVWDLYTKAAFEKYDPDKLKARKGVNVYNDMMYDDQVKACMEFKKNAVLSRGYYFDVNQDNEQHQKIADFFSIVIQKITGSFTDKLLGVLNGLIHGFSVSEKVYTDIQWDNKTWWGLKDIKLRPALTFVDGGFVVDPHGNLLEVKQRYGTIDNKIPLDKIIHFVHQPDVDYHYGESDLKAAYRAYWSKDIAIKFQNIFLERHASGFLYATIEGNIGEKNEAKLQAMMDHVSALTSAMIPKGVTLDSILPQSTTAFENAIAQHDKAIAKSLLVPNLMGITEQGNTGAYAQSQTQIQAFFWTLNATAKRLAENLNENLFRDLALWNFGTDDFPPFTFQEYSDDQKREIAKAWAELQSKGAVSKTDSDEAWIRNLCGAPERTEEDIEAANKLKEKLAGKGDPEDDEDPGDDQDDEESADNDDFLKDQPEKKKEQILKEFASKPWTRRIDFGRTKNIMDDSEKGFIEQMNSSFAKVKESIEKQIDKVAAGRSFGNVSPKEIMEVKAPTGPINELRKTMRDNLQRSLDDGYNIAKTELPKKGKIPIGKKIIRPGMDKTQAEKYISSRTMSITGKLNAELDAAVNNVLTNAIKYDKTLKQVLTAMEDDSVLMSLLPKIDAAGRAVNIPARLENIARTNISDAINQGRQALFGSPELKGFIVAYEYSAILDDRTTAICEHLHGKILKDFGEYTPPNHYQCRSLLIPVTAVDDWDGKESSAPTEKPMKGFY